MIRLILFTTAALTLAFATNIAQADMMIYVEDFKHEGEPGFDPMFNHSFSAEPGLDPYWHVAWNTPPHDLTQCNLLMGNGTKDTITFNLPQEEFVIFASVTKGSPFTYSGKSWLRIIGTNGVRESGSEDFGTATIEAFFSEIGSIEQIEFYSGQDGLINITLMAVPEPNVFFLLLSMAFCGLLGTMRWRFHKKELLHR